LRHPKVASLGGLVYAQHKQKEGQVRFRSVSVVGLLCAVLGLGAACGASSTPQKSASTSSAANSTPSAPPVKLSVAYSNLTPAVLPLWVAADGSIFAKNGLDVTVQYITGSATLPALTSNKVQIAFMGGTEVLNGDLGGANLIAFMNESTKPPYYFSTSHDVTSIPQLKGKKMGVSSFGSTSDTTTREALQAEGINPSDVTFVSVGSPPARASALVGGAIQGALTTPPDSFELAAKVVNNLFNVSTLNLPPEIIAYATTGSYLNAHKDVIQKFTDAIIEAEVYEKNNKSFASEEIGKYMTGHSADVLSKTYDYFVNGGLIDLPPDITADQYKGTVDEIAQKNPAAKTFDLSKIIDDSFVQNAVARGLAK
jgi:NitT/TauT family transport system substrate-binding protein